MCELIENCEFFWNYGKCQGVESRGLVERFCRSEIECGSCERIQITKAKSEVPPPNITPEGDTITGFPIPN